MELPNPFKSQKLTITAIKIVSANQKIKEEDYKFEVMFNPDAYSTTYENSFQIHKPLHPTNPILMFQTQDCVKQNIKIVLDGTGVADTSLLGGLGLGLLGKSVNDRIKQFMKVCYDVRESKHACNYLLINWGIVKFEGFLQSVTINYTLFEPGGEPLRAELDATFIGRNDPVHLSSPDLTHTREVKAGDSLPLLAKEIYGSSRYYLLVAEANQLDDFRNLQPGMKLYFPPLEDQP